MSKNYPKVYKVPNRKIDDQYYLCNNVEDILNSALDAYKTLMDMSLLFEMERPDPDKYGEVTDEMIKNAPSYEVKDALEKTKQKRETWLNGSTWDTKSLKREQYMYNLFVEAQKGSRKAAYHYLHDLGLFEEINLIKYG